MLRLKRCGPSDMYYTLSWIQLPGFCQGLFSLKQAAVKVSLAVHTSLFSVGVFFCSHILRTYTCVAQKKHSPVDGYFVWRSNGHDLLKVVAFSKIKPHNTPALWWQKSGLRDYHGNFSSIWDHKCCLQFWQNFYTCFDELRVRNKPTTCRKNYNTHSGIKFNYILLSTEGENFVATLLSQ